MADTYLPNIVGQFQQGQQFGAEQRQQREAAQRQSRLSELAQLAYTSQGDTRRGYIGQAYGEDPQFAAGLSGQLGKDDESARNELLGAAKLFVSAPEEARPRLLESLRPRFEAYGIDVPDYSPEAAPEFLRNAQAFIAAYGGGGQSDVKVVGNALVDSTGRVVYEAPQRFQTDAGLIEYTPGQGAREITLGGPAPGQVSPPTAAQPPEVTNLQGERGRYSIGADGQPVFIASTTEPNVAQAIQSNAGGFDTQAAVEAPPQYLPPQGAPAGQRILPKGTAQSERRLQLAEQNAERQAAASERQADAAERTVTADLAKGEQALRKEVTDRIKDQRTILTAYDKVKTTAGSPSAANDLALIFSYMKMLDPGSVVREGEFANAQNAAGVPDQVLNIYNRAVSGERLNPAQRQQFTQSAKQIANSAQSQIDSVRNEYYEIAQSAGYDPFRATGLRKPKGGDGGGKAAPAAPAAQRARNPQTGQVIELRNGQWVPVDG